MKASLEKVRRDELGALGRWANRRLYLWQSRPRAADVHLFQPHYRTTYVRDI
jgi:hypothetical protein